MLSPQTKKHLRKQIFPPRPPTRSKSISERRNTSKNNKPAPKDQPPDAAAIANVGIDIRHIPHLISNAWADPDPTPLLSHFAPDPVYVDHSAQVRILSSGSPLRRHHRDRWGSRAQQHHDDDGSGSGSGVILACEVDPDHEVWWRDVDLAAGDGRCIYRTLNSGRRIGGDEARGADGEQRWRDSWEFSGVVDLVIERGKIARFEEWRRLPVADGADGGVPLGEYMVLG